MRNTGKFLTSQTIPVRDGIVDSTSGVARQTGSDQIIEQFKGVWINVFGLLQLTQKKLPECVNLSHVSRLNEDVSHENLPSGHMICRLAAQRTSLAYP